jgi:hypothetical protein
MGNEELRIEILIGGDDRFDMSSGLGVRFFDAGDGPTQGGAVGFELGFDLGMNVGGGWGDLECDRDEGGLHGDLYGGLQGYCEEISVPYLGFGWSLLCLGGPV